MVFTSSFLKLPVFLSRTFSPTTNSTLRLSLKCQADLTQNTKQQVWLYLVVAAMLTARGESASGCERWGAQLRGTPDALPCGGDVRGSEGETAKRAETGSLSSSSPNPQSREKRANTLPEWKQKVSYRKQYQRRANEAWVPGSAAQLSI